jgi:G3E family GTPase
VVAAVDARLFVEDLMSGELASSRWPHLYRDDPRTAAEVVLRHVDHADHLLLVGAEEAPCGAEPCRSLLSHLNPDARILSGLTPQQVRRLLAGRFDPQGAAARLSPAFPPAAPSRRGGSAESATWRRFRPLHPERFYEALDETTATSLRSRGRLWLAGHPDTMVSWEAVGPSLNLEPCGPWRSAPPAAALPLVSRLRELPAVFGGRPRTVPRHQHLTFTGPGLDRARLFGVLDSCLLTRDEERAWAQHGPPCGDPFLPLLAEPAGEDC